MLQAIPICLDVLGIKESCVLEMVGSLLLKSKDPEQYLSSLEELSKYFRADTLIEVVKAGGKTILAKFENGSNSRSILNFVSKNITRIAKIKAASNAFFGKI